MLQLLFLNLNKRNRYMCNRATLTQTLKNSGLTSDGQFVNQESERKARKQFKGLFDKKPGEISEVGAESEGGKDSDDAKGSGEGTSADRDGETKGGPSRESEYAFEEERLGLLGRVWPSARRIFSSLGLNRCTIL